MVRILYLAQGFGVGGAEKQLLYLLRSINRSRFSPTLAAFRADGALRSEFDALALPIIDLDIEFPILRPRNLLPLLRFLRMVRQGHFDVLHSWLFHANVLGTITGRLACVPRIILSERDVGYFHGRFHHFLGRAVFPRATCIVANSQPVVDSLLANKLAQPTQIALIPNGVLFPARLPSQSERADSRKGFGLNTGEFVISSVGRFAPVKGHKHLIAAIPGVLAEFPKTLFALAGAGGCQHELERQAQDLGVSAAVRFLGHVDDASRLLAATDVFVMPSLSEGLANALMEAMAFGCPIVATEVGGNRELIEHERSGLLVPPGDPHVLARAINAQLRDRGRARIMGETAHAAIRHYSVESMAQHTMELYEQRPSAC